MVSSKTRENVSSKFHNANKTELLNDWIRNVKTKKSIVKRKTRGQDLRSIAVLTRTLFQAQEDLRRKQNERSKKWNEMRKLIEENSFNNADNDIDLSKFVEDEQKQQMEMEALWSEDSSVQLTELDNFLKNLSSIKTSIVR
ncbi:unnamed protein product [Diamesa serratosioi]